MVKCNRIKFFGRVYTDQGVFSNPDKIEDVRNMTTPPDLQRFLGLITYLSPHLPKLADKTAILQDLTKEEVPFEWSEDHEAELNNLKMLIATNIGLSYYDQNSPVTLEVDASIKGLSAVLVQNNKPIAWQDMQQYIDYHTVKLQQHRERMPGRSIQHITLPALPVGVAIYCQVRSQTI